MNKHTFKYNQPFHLESGITLAQLEIAYHTFGEMNADQSNVVWVFHALTADSNPFEWWPGLFGEYDLFNPQEYFIICANTIGSCYGSTGPNSEELCSNHKFGEFPLVSVRDISKAFRLLQEHLGITKIKIAIGGSFGGYQALEFAYKNDSLEHLILIATAAVESPWNIASHEAMRQAMRTDNNYDASKDEFYSGMAAARGIGLLLYRTPENYNEHQPREKNQINEFRASSYIRYQGDKLAKRFSPWSYFKLTETLDTHDLGRNRSSMNEALKQIHAKTLGIGIIEDQLALSDNFKKDLKKIPLSEFIEISSAYGHDGFLLETKQLTTIINQFLNQND